MIVLNMHTFSPTDIKERLDPPPGLSGRIGVLHLKRRTLEGRQGLDMIMSVGYAYQNTDDEQRRQKFWSSWMRMHTKGSGARTQHISALDANAHVGTQETREEGPQMVGTAGQELINEQGHQFVRTCEALGIRAINTFTAAELSARCIYAGPTQWNPAGNHRLDFWCASDTVQPLGLWGDEKLTARWQLSDSRDHLVTRFRFRIQLPSTIIPPPKQLRWDWRRLQIALDDQSLRMAFQQKVWSWWKNDEALQQAAEKMTPEGVEEHWNLLQSGVSEIAGEIFLRPQQQRKPWVGEQTLELVAEKKKAQETLSRYCIWISGGNATESTRDWFDQWKRVWRVR